MFMMMVFMVCVVNCVSIYFCWFLDSILILLSGFMFSLIRLVVSFLMIVFSCVQVILF